MGTEYRALHLWNLLKEIVGPDAVFTHTAIIVGHTGSGIILATEEHRGLMAISCAMTTEAMGRDLCNARDRSTYDPPSHPTKGKGWEVFRTEIDGKPCVVVLTAWVDRIF